MFKRNFAVIITTVLLSAAGVAQAASPTFPSAAAEGSEFFANAMLPAAVTGLSGADSVFPSAAREGGESTTREALASTPRNLDRSYADGRSSVFPNSAME